MPAFTFVATVNAVVSASAVPVFAEVDDTLGIDPSDLEQQITDRTAAIIVVHLENVACDLDALLAVAARRNIPVIEDTAQSFGATYHGRALGTFGALGTFSLQQEKNITAGEGGLVVTENETRYLASGAVPGPGRPVRHELRERARRRAHRAVRRREPAHGRACGRGRRGAADEAAGHPRRAAREQGADRRRGRFDRRAGPAPPARPRRRRLVEHHVVPPRCRQREALRRSGAIGRDSLRADVSGASGVPERGACSRGGPRPTGADRGRAPSTPPAARTVRVSARAPKSSSPGR